MAVIFLDRDGVINVNRSDYVKNWDEFAFLPGACAAIARLSQAGHRIIICTNQAGIAKGQISLQAIEEIHHHMLTHIRSVGGSVEAVYYCPHAKHECCRCRKPEPGLLLRARDELALDLSGAVFIGDAISDMQAGLAAGVQPLLVLTGRGREQLQYYAHEIPQGFPIRDDLLHATESILQGAFVRHMYAEVLV